MADRSLKEQLDTFISFYLDAKNAFDVASDNYFGLDDSSFDMLSPVDAAEYRDKYDRALRKLDKYCSVLASFVAAHKDQITIEE